LLRVVAGERLGQVEDQVDLGLRQIQQRLLVLELVEEGVVAVLAQRLQHLLAIHLGAPLALAAQARSALLLAAALARGRPWRHVVARLVQHGDLQLSRRHWGITSPRTCPAADSSSPAWLPAPSRPPAAAPGAPPRRRVRAPGRA